MTDNRHQREVDPTASEHGHLGFVVDFHDPNPNVEGVSAQDPVDVQIKPHPNGYQVTAWWTDAGGDRVSRDEVVRLERKGPQ